MPVIAGLACLKQLKLLNTFAAAQGTALHMLQRYAHDAASRQAFAAAGGIKALRCIAADPQGPSRGTFWYRGESKDDFWFLIDLTNDPAIADAVEEVGGIKVLLNCLHPVCVENQEAGVAAYALARLAATAQGARGIAAAPGSIRTMLQAMRTAYRRDSVDANSTLHGLQDCLCRLAENTDCSSAFQAIGVVPGIIRSN
jgi:hypothetical protein